MVLASDYFSYCCRYSNCKLSERQTWASAWWIFILYLVGNTWHVRHSVRIFIFSTISLKWFIVWSWETFTHLAERYSRLNELFAERFTNLCLCSCTSVRYYLLSVMRKHDIVHANLVLWANECIKCRALDLLYQIYRCLQTVNQLYCYTLVTVSHCWVVELGLDIFE
jgi:hypothetical protein